MKKNVFFKLDKYFLLILVFFTSFTSIKAACIAPTLNCVTRDANNNVTYNWNNNGNLFGTVTMQYSLNGGATWVSSSGSPVSPRVWVNMPYSSSIRYRIQIPDGICSPYSNIVYGSVSSCNSCAAPTLISVVRSLSNPLLATYSWNNNGNNSNTVNLQYSTDGGVTWISNAGSSVSPRTWSIPNVNPIKYRIMSSTVGCSDVFSNIIDMNCIAPTLISAVRSSSNPLSVTFTWTNNGGAYSTTNIEYSLDGGVTWIGNAGGTVSPRTINVPNSLSLGSVQVRLNTSCNQISNSLSVGNLFIQQPTQAIGNFFTDPKNSNCDNICYTFTNTNLICYTDISALNIGVGSQLYIKNTNTQLPVPANMANCILYGNASATSCNRIDTGIRWIRFVTGLQSVIWNVNPNTGIITGSTLTCP